MSTSLPNEVVSALAKRLGFDYLDPQSQASVAELFGPAFAEAWLSEIITDLPQPLQQQAQESIAIDDIDGLLSFLEEKVPDLQERVASILPKR